MTSRPNPVGPSRLPPPVALLLAFATLNAALGLGVAFVPGLAAPRVFAGRYFVIDPTSRLFLSLVGLLFVGIASFVTSRVRTNPGRDADLRRFVLLSIGFMVASELSILSHHMLGGFIFLEATTLLAAPLIGVRTGARGHRAAFGYFLFSGVGLAIAFLGYTCIEHGSLHALGQGATSGDGGLFLDAATEAAKRPADSFRHLGVALLLLGYGTKLGLAPMYAWLPETYEAAPPATTALLAAVQWNVALVGLLRVIQVYRPGDPVLVSRQLILVGVATMAISAFGIIGTHRYKRLLAYASLNHGGVIAIGLGLGRTAAYGVVLYVVANAFIKAILFVTVGKIQAHYGTEDMRKVSGLIKDLPTTGLFFMVGTFALLGFPPFGSFLGELLIMSGLFEAGHVTLFAGFCTILTITFMATARSIFPMIWGAPSLPRAIGSPARTIESAVPKFVYLVALIALGLYLPPPVSALFREVADSLASVSQVTP